jgi:hypothetical protein
MDNTSCILFNTLRDGKQPYDYHRDYRFLALRLTSFLSPKMAMPI